MNEVIAIVMAGGFAKRLWPLTKNKAKPLLEVGGKKIIEHVLEKIEEVPEIGKVIVSTNEKFGKQFEEFVSGYNGKKKTEVFVEPGKENKEKLGALGALAFLINEKKIDDDVLVVAGDNLFEFDLNELIALQRKKKKFSFAVYDVKSIEEAKKFGVITVDGNNKVTGFAEKPEHPESTLVSTGCYVFPKESIFLLKEYLKNNNPDALGFFVSWLQAREEIYALPFSRKWFDIGSFEQLEAARKYFGTKA